MEATVGPPEARTSASVDSFRFPTLTVNDKVADLASSSLSMRSKPNRNSSEVGSSLEESTYEFLGDSVVLTSDDDDGQTESLESNDGDTPDDVTSLPDTDDPRDGSACDSTTNQGRYDKSASALRRTDTDELNGMDSGVTIKADMRLKDTGIDGTVVFEEPKATGDQDETTVTHLLYHCEEPQMPDALRAYEWPRIDIIVRQTMSKQPLVLGRPYRILYVGEHAFLTAIIPKIASALAAGFDSDIDNHRGSSRYNVIPVSGFGGDHLTPDVEVIESSGIDLIVDECTYMTARPSYVRTGMCDLALKLNNKETALISNGQFKITAGSSSSEKVPDLAVFFHTSPQSETARRTTLKGQDWGPAHRSILRSCNIPILDISEELLFCRRPTSYEYIQGSLHVSVERRDLEDFEFNPWVLDRLPVDLLTFSEMDPLQLNRYLACLVPHRQKSIVQRMMCWSRDNLLPKVKTVAQNTSHRYSTRGTAYKEFRARLSRLPVQRWQVTALVGGLILLVISTMLAPYLRTSQPIGQALTPYHNSATRVNSTKSVFSSLRTPKTSDTGKAITKPSLEKSLGQPLTYPLSPEANDSPDFKISSVRANVISLVPPKRFTNTRKPPELFARVMRGDEPVTTQLNKSINGMYLITMEQDQTHGKLNLTIWTKTKPVVSQSFNIALGNRYLKPYTWSKAADKVSDTIRSDVAIAQADLRKMSFQVSAGMHQTFNQIDGSIRAVGRTLLSSAELSREQAKYYAKRAVAVRNSLSQQLAERGSSMYRQALEQHSKTGRDVSQKVRKLHHACARPLKTLYESIKPLDIARMWRNAPPMRKSQALVRARKNACGLVERLKERKSVRAARRKASAADSKMSRKAKRMEGKTEGARKRIGKNNRD